MFKTDIPHYKEQIFSRLYYIIHKTKSYDYLETYFKCMQFKLTYFYENENAAVIYYVIPI